MKPQVALDEAQAAQVADAFTALAQKLTQTIPYVRHLLREAVVVARFTQGNEPQARSICELAARLLIPPSAVVGVLETYGFTLTGFLYGPFEVTRVCHDAKLHTLCVATKRTRVYLHSSPQGKVTPEFEKNRPAQA